ncbi:hypothetical protein BC332_13715 [Capsicum chinense]|nr:hypothetical protein BC332_13715 [Capsicum chinense]
MATESQMMDATMSVGATNIATSSHTNAPPTMALAEKPGKFLVLTSSGGNKRCSFTLPLYVCNEDNEAAERRSKGNSTINGAHIVEDDPNYSKKKKETEQGSNQPKKRFKGKCFNCGKIGHNSTYCHAPKKDKKKDQENMIESNKECDDLCAMFSEDNLTGNPEWWMDFGASLHVCANKELFSLFSLAQVEEMINMTNTATAKVEGTGKICLKMTFSKVLIPNNVLYVPELCRNLVSISLLDKNGFKCVTISGKIIISKGEMYVGKGYLTEGLYKMNVMTIEINKSLNSSYLLESYDL